jgi:hypothetical protein
MIGEGLTARGESNSRPFGSEPFDQLCQILPEEWQIERNQQVGTNSRNLLSPSFVAVCRIFATVFCNLRYIFVTASRSNERNQSANPVNRQNSASPQCLPCCMLHLILARHRTM